MNYPISGNIDFHICQKLKKKIKLTLKEKRKTKLKDWLHFMHRHAWAVVLMSYSYPADVKNKTFPPLKGLQGRYKSIDREERIWSLSVLHLRHRTG
jgi:hypothetical protein